MSEIQELPHVPDAAGIFQFDANKKTLLVPISAIEGLCGQWAAFAETNDVQILPYNNPVVKMTCVDDWEELCKMVHHAFAYGLECNDMTHGEVISDIAFALDRFAKKNGLPEHDWDADYEEKYGDDENSSED